MKKFIILWIFIPLLLTSCSIDWNDTKEKKITELEQQIRELKATAGTSIFDKRTRCGNLAPEIEKRLTSIQSQYKDLGRFSLGGVFYSPVKDACLWIRLTATDSKDGSPMERRALYQYGDDFGASEPIIGCEKILTDTKGVDTCEKWDTEIKRLKGDDTTNVLVP